MKNVCIALLALTSSSCYVGVGVPGYGRTRLYNSANFRPYNSAHIRPYTNCAADSDCALDQTCNYHGHQRLCTIPCNAHAACPYGMSCVNFQEYSYPVCAASW